MTDTREQARAKLDAFGVDGVCEAISDGLSLTAISVQVGVAVASLLTWCELEPDRSARVREARRLMARLWDEKAEGVIEAASDEFELKKAKELAHHYRWRAAKIAPKEYGDKLELASDPLAPVVPAVIQIVGVEPRKP